MTEHKVVGPEQWQAAREELLEREKVHTRMGDELARQRRELPWVAIDKPYRFDTDHGPASLAELFDDRSQLLVYHFMFGPSYQAGGPQRLQRRLRRLHRRAAGLGHRAPPGRAVPDRGPERAAVAADVTPSLRNS
jgi:Bacterial protein of unknown function (DUF899)